MSRLQKIKIRHVVLWLACCGCVAAAPFVFRVDARVQAARGRARKEIEKMTEAERNQLERNLSVFQSLSPEEQHRVRKTQQALSVSGSPNQRLVSVMSRYYDWLTTLSPWQREELSAEPVLVNRIDTIRGFHAAQQTAKSERRRMPFSGREWMGLSRGFRQMPKLSADDYQALLKLIETDAEQRSLLTAEQTSQLTSLDGVRRDLALLDAVVPEPENRMAKRTWPDQILVARMISELSDRELQERVKTQNPDHEQRRRVLAAMLLRGLIGKFRRELEERRPTEEQLTQAFVQLPGERKDKLLELELEHQTRLLQTFFLLDPLDPRIMDKIRRRLTRPMTFGRGGRGQRRRGSESRRGPDGSARRGEGRRPKSGRQPGEGRPRRELDL